MATRLAGKQADAALRRAVLRRLRPLWRRCYWTWPWGHKYGHVVYWSSDVSLISRCLYCGKPWALELFDAYEAWNLAEQLLDCDFEEEDDPVIAPLIEAWRAAR